MRLLALIAILVLLTVGEVAGKAESTSQAVIVHGGHAPYWSVDLEQAAQTFEREGYEVIRMGMPAIPHKGQPTSVFLDPVIAVIDDLTKRGVERIAMVGLSGGGWTTTVACWADQRIDKCFPVAGSLPLRFSDEGWAGLRDYEQLYPPVSYEEMYIKASYILPFYVLDDPCCFPGRQIGDRDLGIPYVIDNTTDRHEISAYVLDIILGNIQTGHSP